MRGSNEPLEEKTTIQVNVVDKDIAEKRLFRVFHVTNHRECYKHLIRFRLEHSNDIKLNEYATTEDMELAEECDCQYRILYHGRLWCCRTRAEIPRPLRTVRQCLACDKRLLSKELFSMKRDTVDKRIHLTANELDLRQRVTDKKKMQVMMDGDGYYPSCQFETRIKRIGDLALEEIKSGECPKNSGESLRYQWHPLDACAGIRCHMLRKSPKTKKASQSK